MTAANELVILHVKGVLLPLYMLRPVPKLGLRLAAKQGLDGLNPILRLQNFLGLVEPTPLTVLFSLSVELAE